MTQEEKQLLLIDLCARLPYGVIVNYKEGEYDFHKWKIETLYAPEYSESGLLIETNCDGRIGYTDYKGCGMSCASRPLHLDKNLPYLRSMSSMTEEEKEEYRNLSDEVIGSYGPYHHEFIAHCVRLGIKPDNPHECVDDFLNMEAIDWLNEHHFDYRGLIPMGLALEASKDMYKTE